MSAGKYSEALPLAQAMVTSLEKGNDERELSAALNNLGQVYAGQGRDDLAEPIYKRAIALLENVARPRHRLDRARAEQSRQAPRASAAQCQAALSPRPVDP